MTLTNPKNNETLTSPFATDLAAKDVLFAKITAGDFSRDPSFAQNLVIAFHNGKLSPAMQFWLHKLAMNRLCLLKPSTSPASTSCLPPRPQPSKSQR